MQQEIEISIQGMTCGGCVRSVQQVLEGLEGITTAAVQLTPGMARITFDPEQLSAAEIAAAVTRAGFTASA